MTSFLVRGGRKDRKFQFLRFLGLIFNSADRFLTFFNFLAIKYKKLGPGSVLSRFRLQIRILREKLCRMMGSDLFFINF